VQDELFRRSDVRSHYHRSLPLILRVTTRLDEVAPEWKHSAELLLVQDLLALQGDKPSEGRSKGRKKKSLNVSQYSSVLKRNMRQRTI